MTETQSHSGADEAPAPPVDLVAIIDRVDDGVLALDLEWRVRYVNEAAGRLLGRAGAELLGKNIWVEFPTAVDSAFDVRYREALRTQQAMEFEEYFELLDAWFSIRVYPSRAGVTLVFRDVTRFRALIEERRAFLDRLLEAEDRERARIAAEVHDHTIQAMGAVTLRLRSLRAGLVAPPAEVESLLDGLGEQVMEATDQLRTLLFSLEPAEEGAPLADSIRRHAAQVFDGSSVHWSVDDVDAGEELPHAERNQALRIAKEALNNAHAHSGASEVIVSIRGDEDGVQIAVADDGAALDPTTFTSAPGHRGLATMRDRAAVVGGWCVLEPSDPHGCTVRVHVPRVRPWRTASPFGWRHVGDA